MTDRPELLANVTLGALMDIVLTGWTAWLMSAVGASLMLQAAVDLTVAIVGFFACVFFVEKASKR